MQGKKEFEELEYLFLYDLSRVIRILIDWYILIQFTIAGIYYYALQINLVFTFWFSFIEI